MAGGGGASRWPIKNFQSIMQIGSSTVGGCGDVNRNIMCTPAPIVGRPEYGYAQKYTKVGGLHNIQALLHVG